MEANSSNSAAGVLARRYSLVKLLIYPVINQQDNKVDDTISIISFTYINQLGVNE